MAGRILNRGRSEGGFTLIELMVVVLVIAILIAIALPSYLGSRNRAQNRAAQSIARLALSAEIVYYGSNVAFSDDNAPGGELEAIEPDINWGSLDATLKGAIASVPLGDDQTVILRSQSRTGTIYCIGRIEAGNTAGTYFTTGCDGTEDTATVSAWPSTVDTGWV